MLHARPVGGGCVDGLEMGARRCRRGRLRPRGRGGGFIAQDRAASGTKCPGAAAVPHRGGVERGKRPTSRRSSTPSAPDWPSARRGRRPCQRRRCNSSRAPLRHRRRHEALLFPLRRCRCRCTSRGPPPPPRSPLRRRRPPPRRRQRHHHHRIRRRPRQRNLRRRPRRARAVMAVARMTDGRSKAKRRRKATVPGVVVTAATLGTTGLAFAYSINTAPSQTDKTAPPSAVTGEIARELAGIAELHASISSTEQQIKALQSGASAPGQPGASRSATPGAATVGTSVSGTSATQVAGTTGSQSSTGTAGPSAPAAPAPSAGAAAPTSAAPAAAAPAPSGSAPTPAPAPASTPAPAPAPVTTPTTNPPPPPPPVTATTGATA